MKTVLFESERIYEIELKIISFTSTYKEPLCLALGFFDGLHIGHRALIHKTRIQAQISKSACGVFTFCDNPFAFLGKQEKLLSTFSERVEILTSLGVDCIISASFDDSFRKINKADFLTVLSDSFMLQGMVCGYDYRFGASAEGDAKYLQRFCAENNIMCNIVMPVLVEDTRVSSSAIRTYVSLGEVEKVSRLLTRSYSITGCVCHGRGIGKLFDFPTANISYDEEKLLPACGVYATYTIIDGKRYKSVTNVGPKPTFEESSLTIESMLIDFEGDLYGRSITVEFVRRLRNIKKYDSPFALRRQIQTDAQWR